MASRSPPPRIERGSSNRCAATDIGLLVAGGTAMTLGQAIDAPEVARICALPLPDLGGLAAPALSHP